MMSAAILSVREMVPEFFIPLALRNEIFYHLPLAAPNGLFLTYTGFQADRSEVHLLSYLYVNIEFLIVC